MEIRALLIIHLKTCGTSPLCSSACGRAFSHRLAARQESVIRHGPNDSSPPIPNSRAAARNRWGSIPYWRAALPIAIMRMRLSYTKAHPHYADLQRRPAMWNRWRPIPYCRTALPIDSVDGPWHELLLFAAHLVRRLFRTAIDGFQQKTTFLELRLMALLLERFCFTHMFHFVMRISYR